MISIEHLLMAYRKIDEINSVKDPAKRLVEFISFQDAFYAEFNDFANELFSRVILSREKSFEPVQQKEVQKVVNQLSIEFSGELDEVANREELFNYLEMQVEGLYWYDKEILKLYVKLGSYRAVGEKTGIPWQSIYKNIQKTISVIRENAPKQ